MNNMNKYEYMNNFTFWWFVYRCDNIRKNMLLSLRQFLFLSINFFICTVLEYAPQLDMPGKISFAALNRIITVSFIVFDILSYDHFSHRSLFRGFFHFQEFVQSQHLHKDMRLI